MYNFTAIYVFIFSLNVLPIIFLFQRGSWQQLLPLTATFYSCPHNSLRRYTLISPFYGFRNKFRTMKILIQDSWLLCSDMGFTFWPAQLQSLLLYTASSDWQISERELFYCRCTLNCYPLYFPHTLRRAQLWSVTDCTGFSLWWVTLLYFSLFLLGSSVCNWPLHRK